MADTPKTRLSFAHERAEFRAQNPLYGKVERASDPFNRAVDAAHTEDDRAAFKARRRAASMVERTHPAPVLKPTPDLAAEADRAAYNALLSAERRVADDQQARSVRLHEAYQHRDRFLGYQERYRALDEARKNVSGTPREKLRDLFRINRRLEETAADRKRDTAIWRAQSARSENRDR